MIRSRFLCVLIVTTVVLLFSSQSYAEQPPKMKMTTPIPEGIETPTRLETHLGTLTSFDGVPDKETAQKIYDDLDLRRATEAFLNALPIASLAAFKSGVLEFGPTRRCFNSRS